MTDSIRYPSCTQRGYMDAHEGDGLVMERPHRARGTVQPQSAPTLTTGRGGGSGVVVRMTNDTVQWFSGCTENGRIDAHPGDGLKVYPNPARENSGGTVQDQSTNALNTYEGCGSATVTPDLRIRYLTPRECLRLMGQTEDAIDRLMEAVPQKSWQYKLAGNSIVVDVLMAIFKGIYIDNTFQPSKPKQTSLGTWGD